MGGGRHLWAARCIRWVPTTISEAPKLASWGRYFREHHRSLGGLALSPEIERGGLTISGGAKGQSGRRHVLPLPLAPP